MEARIYTRSVGMEFERDGNSQIFRSTGEPTAHYG